MTFYGVLCVFVSMFSSDVWVSVAGEAINVLPSAVRQRAQAEHDGALSLVAS